MAKQTNLVRPGILGRAVRIILGIATLTLVWSLATNLRTMWGGDLPVSSLDFWIAFGLTFVTTSWVINESARKNWGQRPLLAGIGLAVIFAVISFFSTGNLFGSVFTTFLWAWAFALTLCLGATLILAGVAGQPGCEMRVYASLMARATGGEPDAVACKGGIDRWDHIGSPDTK